MCLSKYSLMQMTLLASGQKNNFRNLSLLWYNIMFIHFDLVKKMNGSLSNILHLWLVAICIYQLVKMINNITSAACSSMFN